MKYQLLILACIAIFTFGCSNDSNNTDSATSVSSENTTTYKDAFREDGKCLNSFVNKFIKTKLALQDWLRYGSTKHEEYAVKNCNAFLEYDSFSCELSCDENSGIIIRALCPQADGQEIDAEDVRDSCEYFLDL